MFKGLMYFLFGFAGACILYFFATGGILGELFAGLLGVFGAVVAIVAWVAAALCKPKTASAMLPAGALAAFLWFSVEGNHTVAGFGVTILLAMALATAATPYLQRTPR